VELADEALGVAAAFGEPAAAMLAGIVIARDPIRRDARDDDRFIENIVGDEITDFLDLLLAARDLPDLVRLGTGIVLRGISLIADDDAALGERPAR
jgi:hypothetical protein